MADQSKYAELLARARKRFTQAKDAEREIRAEFELDMQFISGDQWDPKVKADRERGPSPRPCLVFNKVLPPVTQLGNQARQNKPAVQVNPVDSAGDPDTAKVLAGMVRHIEYDSDAEQAYDTALFYAAAGSFGYWMYTCEYTDELSFDQDLKIVTIDDPLSIYLDCFTQKPDCSDAKWAFRISRMPNDVHEARFGEDSADLSADFSHELYEEGWRDEDSKQVAEYWEIDTEEKTLRIRKDEDGTVHPVYLEDLTSLEDGEPDEDGIGPRSRRMTPEEIDAIEWVLDDEGEPRERKVELPRVMQYVINGEKVLEAPTRWDGSTIPIVKVTGLEMTVRGKKKIFSMTRFARDPQQLLNFYKTMEAETIALAPKPKWVGAVGQFRTKRRDWQRANTDNAAFVEYDPIAVGDKPAPPPRWEVFDPPVQALAIGAAAAADDIKGSTGYFDPSLGQTKNDQSGVAIQRLQRQGDVSNFHFMDNLARSMKRGGRIVVELIPKKYDTAREVRIIGEDQKQRIVKVNQPFVDENGKAYHHKLDQGKYDVTVQQGPSYTTQRLEAFDQLSQLVKGNPELMQVAGDIVFENSDIIGADRLAKRLKKALPPALQDEDEGEGQQDVPPGVKAQMSQMQQANQMLQEQNKQLMQMVGSKVLELESKERIADQNNKTKIVVAEALSKSDSMNKLAALDHAAVEHQLDLRADLLHAGITLQSESVGQQQDQAHEAATQAADQSHQQQMQTQQQDAAAAQQKAAALQQPKKPAA